ncbi:MAG TPA: type II toxin-antitoxin system RelE/ParE family toxin [Candidatus Avalokitesvara rifleensis]|uniref:type II toxin-antitoxin system RelE/ParE family toxin n=1 Tax=Candidatus Avalokitesvara rifleensis TaxID=3367620 RepID=UPI002712FB9A|nr:type II toxin-antitoxin system RelE/ParE family toxin [Candidatus Brocadiales bacterium]
MHRIVFYTTARGESPVIDFLSTLDAKARTKAGAFIELLAREGHRLYRPYTDTVRGKIRELRIPYRTNQYRVLYFFFYGDSIVLLHAFAKKTQAVPKGELERAERYMQDFINRYEAGEVTL